VSEKFVSEDKVLVDLPRRSLKSVKALERRFWSFFGLELGVLIKIFTLSVTRIHVSLTVH
jgi:hypothetical protein